MPEIQRVQEHNTTRCFVQMGRLSPSCIAIARSLGFLLPRRELATVCASVEVRAARNPVTQAFRSHDRRAILKVNGCPPIYFLLERRYMKNSLETSVPTVRRLKPGNDKEREKSAASSMNRRFLVPTGFTSFLLQLARMKIMLAARGEELPTVKRSDWFSPVNRT